MAALKVKVGFEIPSERAVPISVNRGNPAVLAEPSCDFSKAIFTLAKAVAPHGTVTKRDSKKPRSLARA